MKNWFGIIVFLGMVILNIVLENQKKARLEREDDEADDKKVPPQGHGGYRKKNLLPSPHPEQPAQTTSAPENGTLQDLMQKLFQRETEVPSESGNAAEELNVPRPAPTPVASPVAKPVASPVAAPTRTPVIRPAKEPSKPAAAAAGPSNATSEQPSQQSGNVFGRTRTASIIVRGRRGLRQAVIMAEVLGKPKAWQ